MSAGVVGVRVSRSRILLPGLLLGSMMAVPWDSVAQEEPNVPAPVLIALSAQEGAVSVDGRLIEPIWQAADVASGFTQRDPEDGAPATQRTEARVLITGVAVYVGVRAFDSQPDGIRSQLTRRDRTARSDLITVYFDSYHDRRTSFHFGVTPGGSVEDVSASDDSSWGDESWDPVWQVETTVDSLGWVAEFRIPFTQLRFNRDGDTWGLQIRRRIERNAEEVYWAPYSKEGSGFASRFGVLVGMKDLPSPMRLEVRPYMVMSNRRRPEPGGSAYAPASRSQYGTGLDLKYGFTPDFTLDLTVNPDFGQVEADPAVVNLTAFESYFPEKRPFFVEGSGLFNQYVPYGQLFYSRRIGRPPRGSVDAPPGGTVEVPEASTIVSAMKVTGKSAGGTGIGIMSALTAEEHAKLRDPSGAVVGSGSVEPLAHYFAGRVEQDLQEGSHTVGSMVTAVNRRLGDEFDFLRSAAYMAEVDGRHRWKGNTYSVFWQFAASHVRGNEDVMLSAQRSSFRYYQRPDAGHVEIDESRTSLSGTALRVNASKQAGTWRAYLGYGRVSPGFEVSDAGFQWQADAQEGFLGVSYREVRPRWWFRNFNVSTDFSWSGTTGGEGTGIWVRPVIVNATFRNNWTMAVNPIAFTAKRFSVTELRGGPGLRQNTWHNSFFWLNTDQRRHVSVGTFGNFGGVFGTPESFGSVESELNVRPTGSLSIALGVEYSWRLNPLQWLGRHQVADSTRYVLGTVDQKTLNVTTRLDWTLSPTMSVQLYAQPFTGAGQYSDFKEVIAPRADRFEDRYHVYDEEVVCSDSCAVDLDDDGVEEFSFDQPDFSYRSLRSTMLFRWEYRPGSVLFLAWQHGRSDSTSDGRFGGFGDLGDLFSLESDNTFLIKFNYWLGL